MDPNLGPKLEMLRQERRRLEAHSERLVGELRAIEVRLRHTAERGVRIAAEFGRAFDRESERLAAEIARVDRLIEQTSDVGDRVRRTLKMNAENA